VKPAEGFTFNLVDYFAATSGFICVRMFSCGNRARLRSISAIAHSHHRMFSPIQSIPRLSVNRENIAFTSR